MQTLFISINLLPRVQKADQSLYAISLNLDFNFVRRGLQGLSKLHFVLNVIWLSLQSTQNFVSTSITAGTDNEAVDYEVDAVI